MEVRHAHARTRTRARARVCKIQNVEYKIGVKASDKWYDVEIVCTWYVHMAQKQ